MAATQSLLSNGFGRDFVRLSLGKGCVDFDETCFLCSKHAVKSCKLLGINMQVFFYKISLVSAYASLRTKFNINNFKNQNNWFSYQRQRHFLNP